ncbi:Crp/Fnr family transcriptional regulator [Xanthovirga aplysinae]|uniref:Crp/Fnr family transcriptional regulator n=1 Tax=Xanthovirga aplysinae TaxID=2529853 RepID=UPI0012BD0CAD|nr:Crp/Fnr family transcriptional regulator [Xanthovirga aplysinae]MTI33481.1 Crp/Fnr family transcriptional regulator [Xanthovirga aplysinae]
MTYSKYSCNRKHCKNCPFFSTSVFSALKGEILDRVSDSKHFHHFKKGQVIFNEGNFPLGVFCVSRGKIKIHKLGHDGKEHILRFAGEGDLVGYRSFLTNESYAGTATALEETVVCVFPKDEVFQALKENADFSLRLINLLSKDLKKAEYQLTEISQKTVRERLAEALLLLKERYGLEEKKQLLQVTLTREEIASMIGSTTETVIRTLNDFRKEGIIEFFGRKIAINNLQSLIKTANVND